MTVTSSLGYIGLQTIDTDDGRYRTIFGNELAERPAGYEKLRTTPADARVSDRKTRPKHDANDPKREYWEKWSKS